MGIGGRREAAILLLAAPVGAAAFVLRSFALAQDE
jgi:hypothetical protein